MGVDVAASPRERPLVGFIGSPLAAYVARRLLVSFVLIFVTISLNFFLFRLAPGDAVNFAKVPGATPETRETILREFGLNESVWHQYLAYLNQLTHFNFGRSFATGEAVSEILKRSMANTLLLTVTGGTLALVAGVLTGVLAAWRRKSKADHALQTSALVLYALPAQWLGLMMILLLGGVLPTAGMSDVFAFDQSRLDHILDVSKHMILPVLTFMAVAYGGFAILARSAMLETLGEDYVLTARAKGLSSARILWSHVLRNAMLPLTTAFALTLGYAVAGATLIETVYSWPGIGRGLYLAVLDRDYPLMQGAFLIITISVILFNLIADIACGFLDPRIRL